MTIEIEQASKNGTSSCVTATCGKVRASVCFSRFGVQVVCHNAANRAWRGIGKRYDSAEHAIESFKSVEMKAIIRAAVVAVESL